MQEVYDFLKKCGVFYLATIDNDKPHVRPFGALNIFEGKLYLQTGKVKNVSKQIAINPYVELSGMADGRWIRVEGKLLEDERLVAKESMLEANPELKQIYSAKDDNTQVLYFVDAKATIYSFTSEPIVIEF